MVSYYVYDSGVEGHQRWNIEIDGEMLMSTEYLTEEEVWSWLMRHFKPGDSLEWEENKS